MPFGGIAVPGQHPDVPALAWLGGPRAGQQPGRAAGVLPGPERDRLLGPHHPGARHLGGLDQAGDGDAEGGGQPADGGHTGVRPRLLDLREHALAHARPGRQVVQRPGQPGAMAPHVATHRGVDVLRLRHSLSSRARSNKLIDTFSIVEYTTLNIGLLYWYLAGRASQEPGSDLWN